MRTGRDCGAGTKLCIAAEAIGVAGITVGLRFVIGRSLVPDICAACMICCIFLAGKGMSIVALDGFANRAGVVIHRCILAGPKRL